MKLTVVIRDEAPLRFLNEPLSFRTVQIALTDAQARMIELRDENEAVQMVILEPSEGSDTKGRQ